MSATTDRVLPGEKAGRIVDAMRRSVAQRGVAGSTFDVVAREAGVSRGLLRRTREHVADLLAAKQAEGVLRLGAEPEAVADVLFSLADGVAMRMLAEPERDWAATIDAGVAAVRHLLSA